MKKLLMMKIVLIVASMSMFTVKANALTYNVYNDLATFSAAAGTTSVYDFESDTVGGNYKLHDFGDFSVNGSSLYRVTIENEATYELNFNTSSYTQNMSLTFDQPITSFGFDWRNTDNNDDMIRVIFDNTMYVLGSKDQSGFWGIVATQGQVTTDMSFLFGDTNGGSGWTEGNLDNLRYNNGEPSPTPEPATMILFGIGLLGLAGVNRRKQ